MRSNTFYLRLRRPTGSSLQKLPAQKLPVYWRLILLGRFSVSSNLYVQKRLRALIKISGGKVDFMTE